MRIYGQVFIFCIIVVTKPKCLFRHEKILVVGSLSQT